MKKILTIMLVCGITFSASATISTSVEFRDSTGTSVITAVDVTVDTDFTAVVVGTYASAEADAIRLYDHAGSGGLADITGITMLSAAGGGGAYSAYDTTYDGYDMNFGDPLVGQTDADMFVLDLSVLGGQTSGTFTLDSLDVNYGFIEDFSIEIVPEPMTMALLGLGGFFLRRRK